MTLEPVRIEPEFWYACATRPAVMSPTPGTCPFDKKPMMRVVTTVFWTCKGDSDKLMDPGKCPDGSARTERHEVRAHGDHNPRHGGSFYMATDTWHHVEGTYPRAGLFRVYFYDNFTQPIDAKGFTARLLDENQKPIPLKAGREKHTMEAALTGDRPPLKLAFEVKFDKDQKDNHFDFTFTEFSKEPAVAVTTTTASATKPAATKPATTTTAGASTAPRQTATTAKPATVTPPAPPPVSAAPAMPTLTNCEPNVTRTDVLLLSDALPKETKALLNLLTMCGAEVQKLIAGGQFGFVYQPTMLGKDIALALDNHINELPDRRRVQAADGIRRTVLSAWQLDMYGDIGNQSKLSDAFKTFAAAIADITSAYGAQP
jgi:hypothetical protein